MEHQCVVVSPGGTPRYITIAHRCIQSYIEEHKKTRQERALIIDGLIVHHGHLTKEECECFVKEARRQSIH